MGRFHACKFLEDVGRCCTQLMQQLGQHPAWLVQEFAEHRSRIGCLTPDAMPVNLALLITGIGIAVIVLVIVGALVVDRVDKAKDRRSRK